MLRKGKHHQRVTRDKNPLLVTIDKNIKGKYLLAFKKGTCRNGQSSRHDTQKCW